MELIYYAAISLGGAIARADGSIAWLDVFNEGGEDYGFAEFYSGIDALVMGSRTYEQVLGFDVPWPYGETPCHVMSRRALEAVVPTVHIHGGSPDALLEQMRAAGHRRVWLVGGGAVAGAFAARGAITEYHLASMPVVLGAGIPLVSELAEPVSLELIETKRFDSGVQLVRYRPCSGKK